MSLIAFHKVLITTAIIFSLGFSIWAFQAYSQRGDTGMLILAMGSVLAFVVLAVYLRHLRRFLGRS